MSSRNNRNIDGSRFVQLLREINDQIGDPNYHVGISYFMNPKVELSEHIREIWCSEIEPYLDELLYGQSKEIGYRWSDVEKRLAEVW